MSAPNIAPASGEASETPCRCHGSHAAVTPFHPGHCCFFPPDRTCHPEEVTSWEAEHDRWLAGQR